MIQNRTFPFIHLSSFILLTSHMLLNMSQNQNGSTSTALQLKWLRLLTRSISLTTRSSKLLSSRIKIWKRMEVTILANSASLQLYSWWELPPALYLCACRWTSNKPAASSIWFVLISSFSNQLMFWYSYLLVQTPCHSFLLPNSPPVTCSWRTEPPKLS